MMASYHTVHSNGRNCHPTRYNHANANRCVDFTYPNKFSYMNTGNFIEPRGVQKPRQLCK